MSFSQYQRSKVKKTKLKINLAEILSSLSYALDMTEGQPEGHCIRCCWIGTKIGETLNVTDSELSDLYFTLLLKDLGCSSNAARICELYLTDDISFKRDFKSIDGSLGAALKFVFAKTGLETGLSERIRAIVNILQYGGEISRELIETRCQRGADIAGKMRFSEQVQSNIRNLDEHWDGSGKPNKIAGNEIPLGANIALLAQVVDIFHNQENPDAAVSEIKARSGSWFNPDLVEAFMAAQSKKDFWPMLRSNHLDKVVLSMKPSLQSEVLTEDYIDQIAAAFSDIVDAKSPYTADHSNRVTFYTDMIAEQLGLADEHRRWLRRAALLHDIGKLAVSNQILDKPGKLDEKEWSVLKSHPYHSEQILNRVSAFSDIAPVAGAHHERLDGQGYPYGLSGDDISVEARILTVADVFDALSAERPYRAAIPMERALAILDEGTGHAFDADCVQALKSGLEELGGTIAA